MEKIWFVAFKGKKKGPFSNAEIKELLQIEEINSYTLLWKKGFPKWLPLSECRSEIFLSVSNAVPELPEIPVKKDLPDLPAVPTVEKAIDKTEVKPSLPPVPAPSSVAEVHKNDANETVIPNHKSDQENDEAKEDHEDYKEEVLIDEQKLLNDDEDESGEYVSLDESEISEEYHDEEQNENEESLEPQEREGLSIFSIIGGLFLLLTTALTCFILFFFSSHKSEELQFKNISLNVLNSITKEEVNSKFYVNFGIDKNLNTIFARSNLSKDAVYDVVFKSLRRDKKNQIQSEFSSHAKSVAGKLKFDEFDFLVGEQILEGEYEIKVNARLSHTIDVLLNYILGRPYEFSFEEKTYLVKESIKKFKEDLKKIELNKVIKEKENFNELEEKIKTIKSILQSLSLTFSTSLNNKMGTSAANQFAAKYSSSAGSILQNIIVTDYKNAFEQSKKKVELQSVAEEVLMISKDIAAWSADLMSEVEKSGRLNDKKRKKLKEKMNTQNEKFMQSLDDVLIKLDVGKKNLE